jgi:beta-phosphoglucomutase
LDEIRAFIFDLDGVLVDTAVYHFKGWKRLADELRIPFTEEDNEQLKGVSREGSLEILLNLGGKSFTDDEKKEMMDRKNEWYLSYVDAMEPEDVLPGAREILEELKDMGLKIGLGSSSKNARKVLELTELTPYFDAIVDGTMISKAKPDPELFLKCAKLLEERPENCVVFEDAEAGLDAAIAGGMKTVGVGTNPALKKANTRVVSMGALDLSVLPFNF